VPCHQQAANLIFQTNVNGKLLHLYLFRSQETPLFSVYLKNTALCRHLDNPAIWSMTEMYSGEEKEYRLV